MSDRFVGVSGAKQIAHALVHNTSLKTLDISRNDIRQEGALAIAASLKANHSLRRLNLENNNIDEKGATALADALSLNSTLISVNLRGNHFGPGAVRAFRQIIPVSSALRVDLDENPGSLDAGAPGSPSGDYLGRRYMDDPPRRQSSDHLHAPSSYDRDDFRRNEPYSWERDGDSRDRNWSRGDRLSDVNSGDDRRDRNPFLDRYEGSSPHGYYNNNNNNGNSSGNNATRRTENNGHLYDDDRAPYDRYDRQQPPPENNSRYRNSYDDLDPSDLMRRDRQPYDNDYMEPDDRRGNNLVVAKRPSARYLGGGDRGGDRGGLNSDIDNFDAPMPRYNNTNNNNWMPDDDDRYPPPPQQQQQSQFQPPMMMQQSPPPPPLAQQPQGKCGVGIVFKRNHRKAFFEVEKMYPDGPAARSKQICVGDVLLAINGRSMENATTKSLTDLIVGPAGSSVDMTFEIEENGRYIENVVTLKRAPVTRPLDGGNRDGMMMMMGSRPMPGQGMMMPVPHHQMMMGDEDDDDEYYDDDYGYDDMMMAPDDDGGMVMMKVGGGGLPPPMGNDMGGYGYPPGVPQPPLPNNNNFVDAFGGMGFAEPPGPMNFLPDPRNTMNYPMGMMQSPPPGGAGGRGPMMPPQQQQQQQQQQPPMPQQQPPSSQQAPVLCGVGVTFKKTGEKGLFEVKAIQPGGPCDVQSNGRVKIGDVLVSVNDRPVAKMNYEQLAEVVKGPEGSRILLCFQSDSSRGVVKVPLVRGGKQLDANNTRRGAEDTKIGPKGRGGGGGGGGMPPPGMNNGNNSNNMMMTMGGGRGDPFQRVRQPPTGVYGRNGPVPPPQQQQQQQQQQVAPHQQPPMPTGVGISVQKNVHGDYFVCKILPGSPADMTRKIFVGDILSDVNGTPINHMPQTEVREILNVPGMITLGLVDPTNRMHRQVPVPRGKMMMGGGGMMPPQQQQQQQQQQQGPPMMMGRGRGMNMGNTMPPNMATVLAKGRGGPQQQQQQQQRMMGMAPPQQQQQQQQPGRRDNNMYNQRMTQPLPAPAALWDTEAPRVKQWDF